MENAPSSSADGAAAGADVSPAPLHSGAELLAACESSEAHEAMRLLGIAGVDVNARDYRGKTPLHYACMKGHTQLVLALVANEAVDVSVKDWNGKTPLLYACKQGLREVALALIASEAVDVSETAGDGRSGCGKTPLHFACEGGHTEVALALVAREAVGVHARDENGKTPLHYACEKGHERVALALVANEAVDVNAKTEDGKTALHFACKSGLKGVALALLAKPNLNIHTSEPNSKVTPLSFAHENQLYSVLQAARAHPRFNADSTSHVSVQKHYADLDAFLGRYALDPVPPVHRSATCLVRLARDIEDDNAPVALKLMRNHDEFEREIAMREHIGHSDFVIGVLGWHTPSGFPTSGTSSGGAAGQRSAPTAADAEFPDVLVMERGGQSLFIENVTQRTVGVDATKVSATFRSICECVAALHEHSLVHGNLKLRNVIRRIGDASHDVCLGDLDTAIETDAARPLDFKLSTAYAAPELRASLRDGITLVARPSLDVWSLGTILFELCARRALFAQDISDDSMVERDDEMRLATWSCIQDDVLGTVLTKSGAACNEVQRADARHLIRWCLRGDAAERPSLAEILAHRFVGGNEAPPPAAAEIVTIENTSLAPRIGAKLRVLARSTARVSYDVFISHAQIEASGDVRTLFSVLEQMGVHGYQGDLTEAGMRQGVYDSDLFVLFLTNSVLSRTFCQKELGWAIEFEKPIVVVVEEEQRFWPFDYERWSRDVCNKSANLRGGSLCFVPMDSVSLSSSALTSSLPSLPSHLFFFLGRQGLVLFLE